MAWLMNPFEPNLMVVAAMQTTNIFLSTQFTRGKLCLNLGGLFEIEDTNFWKWQQNSARVQLSQGNHACLPSPRQWIDHTSPHSATLLPNRPHFWKKNFCPITLPPTLTIGQLGVCPSKDSCWYSDWLCFRENLPVRVRENNIILLLYWQQLLASSLNEKFLRLKSQWQWPAILPAR